MSLSGCIGDARCVTVSPFGSADVDHDQLRACPDQVREQAKQEAAADRKDQGNRERQTRCGGGVELRVEGGSRSRLRDPGVAPRRNLARRQT